MNPTAQATPVARVTCRECGDPSHKTVDHVLALYERRVIQVMRALHLDDPTSHTGRARYYANRARSCQDQAVSAAGALLYKIEHVGSRLQDLAVFAVDLAAEAGEATPDDAASTSAVPGPAGQSLTGLAVRCFLCRSHLHTPEEHLVKVVGGWTRGPISAAARDDDIAALSERDLISLEMRMDLSKMNDLAGQVVRQIYQFFVLAKDYNERARQEASRAHAAGTRESGSDTEHSTSAAGTDESEEHSEEEHTFSYFSDSGEDGAPPSDEREHAEKRSRVNPLPKDGSVRPEDEPARHTSAEREPEESDDSSFVWPEDEPARPGKPGYVEREPECCDNCGSEHHTADECTAPPGTPTRAAEERYITSTSRQLERRDCVNVIPSEFAFCEECGAHDHDASRCLYRAPEHDCSVEGHQLYREWLIAGSIDNLLFCDKCYVQL